MLKSITYNIYTVFEVKSFNYWWLIIESVIIKVIIEDIIKLGVDWKSKKIKRNIMKKKIKYKRI